MAKSNGTVIDPVGNVDREIGRELSYIGELAQLMRDESETLGGNQNLIEALAHSIYLLQDRIASDLSSLVQQEQQLLAGGTASLAVRVQ